MRNRTVSPMLAHRADPFDSPDHLFEIKWDGTRCVLFVEEGRIRLQNRRLRDITHRYPELIPIHEAIAVGNAVLDGELVVFSEGAPDFKLLQQREHLTDPLKIKLISQKLPCTYVAFDVLAVGGESCARKPLNERKRLLSDLLQDWPHLLESTHILRSGILYFRQAVSSGLEGVMAKHLRSPYLFGKRSRHWLKIKSTDSARCRIVGYTPGKGARARYFGALLVAAREHGEWIYRGKVGSGFTDRELASISGRLEALETDAPALPVKAGGAVRWVRPELSCEVSYQEVTPGGHFRAPVFRGMAE